jgi:hypothetical protein
LFNSLCGWYIYKAVLIVTRCCVKNALTCPNTDNISLNPQSFHLRLVLIATSFDFIAVTDINLGCRSFTGFCCCFCQASNYLQSIFSLFSGFQMFDGTLVNCTSSLFLHSSLGYQSPLEFERDFYRKAV